MVHNFIDIIDFVFKERCSQDIYFIWQFTLIQISFTAIT